MDRFLSKIIIYFTTLPYINQNKEAIKMIMSQGKWVVEENECIYGEYGELVGKKPSVCGG